MFYCLIPLYFSIKIQVKSKVDEFEHAQLFYKPENLVLSYSTEMFTCIYLLCCLSAYRMDISKRI